MTQESVLEWALRYIKLGWAVFPLQVKDKKPLITEWQKRATLNEAQVREWWTKWPNANIGIRTGDSFFVFDIDLKDGGEESADFLKQQYGPFPDTIQQVTGTGSGHVLFQMPDFGVRNLQKSKLLGSGIDIRGVGGYIVAAPSIHPETGREYFWDGIAELEDQKLAPAPKWLLDKLRSRLGGQVGPVDAGDATQPAPPLASKVRKGEGRHGLLVSTAGSMRRRGLSAKEILPTLLAVNQERCDPPYDEPHVRQIAASMEKYPAGSPVPYADRRNFRLADEPQQPDDKSDKEFPLNALDVEAAADRAIAGDNIRAAIELAPEVAKLPAVSRAIIGVKFREKWKRSWPARDFDRAIREAGGASPPRGPGDSGDDDGDEDSINLAKQPFTDAGNGERIAAYFGHEIRYCVEMKNWLVWSGKRWVIDEMGSMWQKGKEVARETYRQGVARQEKALMTHARESESHPAVRRALAFAATEPGIPILAAELDQHPFLFNCPNGVIDLRNRQLLPHDRGFLITKLCPVEYEPAAMAPRFIEFIHWAMGCVNPEAELTERTSRLVGFLQRSLGYALTGDTSEKALFVLYGKDGNNGKSTLLSLFRELMGKDYAGQILIETVMTMRNANATAQADLADLRGARLVITSEVNKESRLDEGKIKYITSGMSMPVKSCRKWENPIEFIPTHKLLMECNHRPVIRGTDPAIWNRLKPIPFEVSIADSEKDTDLPAKLRVEYKGILAWAVRGCESWFKNGLEVPEEVKQANEEWRDHDDPLRDFLQDYCKIDIADEDCFVPVAGLYGAYRRWGEENGERYLIGRETFNDRLTSKGLKQARSRRLGGKQTRTWEGIRLLEDSSSGRGNVFPRDEDDD